MKKEYKLFLSPKDYFGTYGYKIIAHFLKEAIDIILN